MAALQKTSDGERRPVILLFWLLIWGSVSVRWVMEFVEEGNPAIPTLVGILVVFGLLLIARSMASDRRAVLMHGYLAVQTVLVYAAMRLYIQLDFFALLYLPLAGQAVLILNRREAGIWVGILLVATVAGQIDQFGWPEALPFILLYATGVLFVALFSRNTIRAETARRQSEDLLAELRRAHSRLQEYAGQAEALAIAEERNRLARDLHDSVAQTLYGLTLRSEAALRHLQAGRLDRLEVYLREFQESTLQSLRETRLLIHELRPQILEEKGLAAALAHRLEHVEKRSGLQVEYTAGALPALNEKVEAALYRIALEALNNVLKHARAVRLEVTLALRAGALELSVADDGIGFEVEKPGGVGFQSMHERAAQIGGILEILPGETSGMRMTVRVPEEAL